MEFNLARKLLVQPLKKLKELLMPMMGVALANHFTLRDFQGSEERCSAAILILGGMRRRHEEIDWEKVA
jgi:hypothetical protein